MEEYAHGKIKPTIPLTKPNTNNLNPNKQIHFTQALKIEHSSKTRVQMQQTNATGEGILNIECNVCIVWQRIKILRYGVLKERYCIECGITTSIRFTRLSLPL